MYLVRNIGNFTVYLEKNNYAGNELVAILKPNAEKYVDDLKYLKIRLPYGIGQAQAVEATDAYFKELLQVKEVKEVLNENI
jgi:hypothetical protein